MREEDILKRLLYRDGLMLILDKPAGLPVHAGSGGGENLEQYFHFLQFGLPSPPALAHRLDRDTSGCLILGRHRKALRRLGMLFQHGSVDKVYWAVVHGKPDTASGRINLPLAKQTSDKRRWWMEVNDAGVEAITDYTVMGAHDDYTWLALSPKTGRTHQLRVHCAAMGWPIVGDPVYGSVHDGTPMQLHARTITVPLYPNRDAPPITATAPVPGHLQELLRLCGFLEEVKV